MDNPVLYSENQFQDPGPPSPALFGDLPAHEHNGIDSPQVDAKNLKGTLATAQLPVVPISKGGTGQITKALAFDALAPTSNAGDIPVHNGSANAAFTIGANGQILSVDTAQSQKVKWIDVPGAKINISNTDVTVSSSTSKTALISFTIPGGTLGTNKGVVVRGFFQNFKCTNTTHFIYDFGTTNMGDISVASTNGQTLNGYFDLFIAGNGATNIQEATFHITGDPAGYTVTSDAFRLVSNGTAAEDSTADKTFVLSIQFNTSSSSDKITFIQGYAFKIV